jgi:hypothetical protein
MHVKGTYTLDVILIGLSCVFMIVQFSAFVTEICMYFKFMRFGSLFCIGSVSSKKNYNCRSKQILRFDVFAFFVRDYGYFYLDSVAFFIHLNLHSFSLHSIE